jgi:hypothetical protein
MKVCHWQGKCLPLYLFHGTRVLTQGLTVIQQALYHLSHSHRLFFFSYFQVESLFFASELTSGHDSPTSASPTVGLCYHTWLIFIAVGSHKFYSPAGFVL